jgi:hypothetical protein
LATIEPETDNIQLLGYFNVGSPSVVLNKFTFAIKTTTLNPYVEVLQSSFTEQDFLTQEQIDGQNAYNLGFVHH